MMKRGFVATLLTLSVAALAACASDTQTLTRKTVAGGDAGATGTPTGIPFEPVTADVYVPKVKFLLTGFAATDAEVQSVKKDPTALKGLIDAWMTLPSFKVRMTDFYRNAFQQNQVDLNQLFANVGINMPQFGGATAPQLARNIMDSFALTAWQIAADGKPFNTTLTTRTYMMTTALASFVAYLDEYRVEDSGKSTNRFAARIPVPALEVSTSTNYAATDSLNPASPNYMKFSFPGQTGQMGCATTTQTYTATVGDNNFSGALFNVLFGRAGFQPCANMNGTSLNSDGVAFSSAEFNDWRPITFVVDAAAAGTTPAFHEINKLKTASTMTVHSDKISFWSTPAFVANWGTNNTNEMRVTANQALIVAEGQSIQSEDTIVNFPVDATDASHASNPACTGCHNQLDPFKQFFRQSYSEFYGEQVDKQQVAAQAGYSIGGLNQTGKGISDLAKIFASNPRFPVAWVGKLYFWANSTAAIETDPELLRVATAFATSNFDFKTLIRELFSSPLITWSAETETTKTNGVINSIARRDQFCASLSVRLQVNDVCGTLSTSPSNTQQTIAQRALMLATDTYFRSYALATVPTEPTLFFRLATETICSLVADQVIDVQGGGKYSSAEPDKAIDDFVSNVMGIVPTDARYAASKSILTDNFTQSSSVGGIDKTTALKATFQLACLAPTSVMVGQ